LLPGGVSPRLSGRDGPSIGRNSRKAVKASKSNRSFC
jgi:hypothetical protein